MYQMTDADKKHTLEIIIKKAQSSERYTARDIQRAFQTIHGTNLDWHEFSNYLDLLNTKKIIRAAGVDRTGMMIYELNI